MTNTTELDARFQSRRPLSDLSANVLCLSQPWDVCWCRSRWSTGRGWLRAVDERRGRGGVSEEKCILWIEDRHICRVWIQLCNACVNDSGAWWIRFEHTGLVGVLLPETLPLAEIEWHTALGIDNHRKGCVVSDRVEKLGVGISYWVGRDVEQFGWTGRGGEWVGVPDTDQ